jgi:hypothetical protein
MDDPEQGKKVVSITLEFHSSWEVDDTVPTAEAEAQVVELMREFLADRQSVLYGDYGKAAWGGWDGPFIVKSDVIRKT